jgi:hypothetical protein
VSEAARKKAKQGAVFPLGYVRPCQLKIPRSYSISTSVPWSSLFSVTFVLLFL